MRISSIGGATVALAVLCAPGARAQTSEFLANDLTIGPIVRNAPYSAEAVTLLSQTLGDGTRIERTTTAKIYRDSAGRERRELTVTGLSALNPLSGSETLITIFDPVQGATFTLDPRTRTARGLPLMISGSSRSTTASVTAGRGPDGRAEVRSMIIRRTGPSPDGSPAAVVSPPAIPPPPPPPPAPPPGSRLRVMIAPPAPPSDPNLGTRQIEGLTATGVIMKTTIPVGQIGNDRPIDISDEQWSSADLKVTLLSKHHDPRTGDVEYRLTNIIRSEPAADLFTVPSDYKVTGIAPFVK